MKYQKHYLSDEGNNKYCPLQGDRVIQCDSYCAWFDHEEQDCRMIGGFWKVREQLTELKEQTTKLEDDVRWLYTKSSAYIPLKEELDRLGKKESGIDKHLPFANFPYPKKDLGRIKDDKREFKH